MSKKNKNPYNVKSNYGKLFAAWKTARTMTRAAMLEVATGLGMTATAASATVTVMLSPRKSEDESRGADCLGNISAKGHIYYADKLNRKKNEAQRFQLRYRSVVLAPKTRKVKEELKSVKAKAESKAKSTAKTDTIEA
jgi:hypothetical protein